MKDKSTATNSVDPSLGNDLIRLVSFKVGSEQFAVDILRVQEINRMMELTQVPQSPAGVCGVINLRGRIVPVLDLRTRLGIQVSEQSEASRIIVVEIQGSTVGFIVDAVHQVLQIDPRIIEPTPQITSGKDTSYIQGVAKLDASLMILLDLDKLISTESLDMLDSVRSHAA
jgi:purine-binding chemotaxis protein CheW